MTENTRPYRPIRLGEILKEEMDARCWTRADLAKALSLPAVWVDEILAAEYTVGPAVAAKLSRVFVGTSPEFWLNLEEGYKLDLLKPD